MKKYIILLLLLSIIPIAGAVQITGLTAIPSTDEILLQWDDVGGPYTIAKENYSIHYTDTPPVLDGIIEPPLVAKSHKYMILTPNYITPQQLDYSYILWDANYVYFGVECHDADVKTQDDFFDIFFDIDGDGVDIGDRKYRIREDGLLKSYEWGGATWDLVVNGANGVTTGAGTSEFTIEYRIPVSEFDNKITNNSYHKILLKRSCEDLTPAVSRYFLSELCFAVSETNSDLWAEVNVVIPDAEGLEILDTTSNNYYTATVDCSFNWYRFWVYPTGIIGDNATIDVVSLDTPSYNVSGTVYNGGTGAPLFNAETYIRNGFVFDRSNTDISGDFLYQNVHNGTYTIVADKTNFENGTHTFILNGSDVTGIEIYLDYTPEADITETSTTDIKTVYLLTAVALVFLIISFACICFKGVDITSIFTMIVPTWASFKISNLYIGGTLSNTQKFLSSADTVIVKKEILRNTAMSNLYEFIAIGLFIILCLQVYIYIKSMKVERDF